MKLHYFADPKGNFGDDLNPWLWPRVAPGLLDDDASEILVGIGTLINHRLPAGPVKHVMGSGVGYGQLPRLDDDRFVFHAVRGHHSARALGLPAETVITDAAVLLRATDWKPRPSSRPKVNLVLTGESIVNYDWKPVCDAAGVGIISCHESVEDVLSAISGSELILADAMHGAIAADTLRVPWVGVTCNENILASKWEDWLSSLSMSYQPEHIEPLFDGNHGLDGLARVKRLSRAMLSRIGAHAASARDLRPKSSPAAVERAVQQLRQAARARPQLSETAVLDRCVERFQQRLRQLRERRPAATAALRAAP